MEKTTPLAEAKEVWLPQHPHRGPAAETSLARVTKVLLLIF
jgi:hypothetical protein